MAAKTVALPVGPARIRAVDQETDMRSTYLCAAGLSAAILIGCGGGGDDAPVVAAPVAPAAITCSTSAAQLTKTTLKVAGVDREYYDSAPVNYAARARTMRAASPSS